MPAIGHLKGDLARAAILCSIALMTLPRTASSQNSAHPEPVLTLRTLASPFAAGGTNRKTLPPLDCLHCTGPSPCPPCDAHHQGFLYYGTAPRNGLDSAWYCSDGDCGRVAAGLSRAWIQLHKHRKPWTMGCSLGNCE